MELGGPLHQGGGRIWCPQWCPECPDFAPKLRGKQGHSDHKKDKQKSPMPCGIRDFLGDPAGTRTPDPRLKRQSPIFRFFVEISTVLSIIFT